MKKRKKKGLKKRLKKGVVLLSVGFLATGIFLNSDYAKTYQDSVYAELKDKYGIAIQTEPDVIEDTQKVEKNYSLTVDSDLRIASNATAEDIDKMLEGTALHGLGNAFVEAEKKYNVNALYMMGLAALESAWGTSGYAVYRNNLYGWNAVDSNPDNATYFNSKEEATLYVAKKLKQNYLTENGAYFEGYSPRAIDVHYCTDKQHADKIVSIVNSLTEKLG